MKVRKLLAGILSATMVLGTMVVPASAAEQETTHYYNVLPTETNNVLTMGGENDSDCIYEFNTDTQIDLTGKTLKMTGEDVCISVYSNVTITGGTIDVNVTNARDGIFRIGYFADDGFSLTLKNVTINLNDTKSAAGVFYLWNANNSLTLENCKVTGTNLNISGGVFYTPDQNGNRGKVSISGGDIDVTNSKGLFFSTDVDIDDVNIKSSTGRPAFRFAEGTVSGSTLDVTITSTEGDAAVDCGNKTGSVVRFVDTAITAANGTTFATAGSATTDAKSTLNKTPLSEVENVTLKIANKLPEAVNGVITLTENVTLKSETNIYNKSVIDLNDYTLTLTGIQSRILVWNDTTFKNGKINVSNLTTGDGVFYVQSGTLTFDDVDITVDGMYPPKDASGAYENTTGVFRNVGSGSRIVLNDTDVVTDNLYDAYLFYDELAQNDTSFEINGGRITMNNGCTVAGQEDHYSKSMFFATRSAVLNGVKVKVDCGRSMFRASSRTTSDIRIVNSEIEAKILRNSDVVNEGQTVTFINSKLNTTGGAGLTSGAGKIVSDTNTTYNGGRLIDVEGVEGITVWETMTDSGKYAEGNGVIRFSFKVNPTKSFGAITKAGIKFVNTENTEIGEETSIGVEQSGANSVFYADIKGITGSGKYFARAYISNGTSTEWSDMVEASVDWDRTFTAYAE